MKNICDICGKEFEGYGNNPAPLEGRICCDACNKTYVIPARLKKIDVKSKLGDASMETPQITELRKKIGYLISEEVRAIDDYDEALKTVDLSEDQRKTLEEIRNDEIDHTNKLNEIYKGLMTGAVEDDLTEDASNLEESFAGGYDPTTINTELETEPNVQDGLIESVSNVVEKIGNLSTAAEDCGEKVKDAKSWIVGKTYRQKVNSKQGYEDWEFTGKTLKGPDGKILHAMKSMDLGTQWFDEDELNEMNIIDDDQDVQKTLKENEISSSVTDAKMTVDRMIQIITPIVSDYAKKKGVEDYWKIHKNGKNVSVGMELGYRDMDKLCDILNAKLAPLTDSYFEPADAGLIETTVFDSAIRDSDTVNDIGEITVGSKYRFEERYGNQPLTVMEVGETVKLSLDNSKTYIRVPREKFESMVKSGKLDNTDTTTIEQYGAIKTGDRRVVDFKSDELVNEIRTKFNSLGKSKIDAYVEQLKAKGGYKDLATRLVWDLLHSTTSSRDISDWYYKYDVNDNHITNAGKEALKRMGINL